ncbi:MAG: hypothetical protein ABI678_03225 [Kofleriaceae bacterium]
MPSADELASWRAEFDASASCQPGWAMAKTVECRQAEEIRDAFAAHDVRYLVFAPDGIEPFEDAWGRHVEIEGFPVCHPADIVASKMAANRAKDRETLPRLRAFVDYWNEKNRGSE